MAQIKVVDLAVGYETGVVADNINFEVNKGDYLSIVGENGAGKSTLVKTLLGLQAKMGGDIIYGDGLKAYSIGYLPQHTSVQKDFPASVGEIVLSGCQAGKGFNPFYSKADKALAKENMKKLGIDDMEKHCYRELSGGQQQRVLLARALCATKELLLLDEPVAGLDPVVTAEMYKLIEDLNKEGITIIMISHDIANAVNYSTHILHIGSKFFFGTTEEYKKSDIGALFVGEES
ncbi:MAG: metal ABC transporter ATP-binding protein [Lachnospiraceae bacterium]|nr:metal ABC transporter ATP-binding protein [Lachnospiraceae bacterium]